MYGIYCNARGYLRSAQVQRLIGDCITDDNRAEAMRHCVAIESLESRGQAYSNQSFDVLGQAIAFIDRNTTN